MTVSSAPAPIRPRERDALLQALRAGVVPAIGQRHIQVGRARELTALLTELDRVADAGAAFRLVIGEYGSGKTFFLNLVRAAALEKKLVTLHADLNPDRRLHATGGQARSLYSELTRNMATRTKPEGGALGGVVEKFIVQVLQEAQAHGSSPEQALRHKLAPLNEMVGGYDFATVLTAYWTGFDTGNEALKSDALRWLRGEFSTKTDARAALGVRTLVEDATMYDHLKLLAAFVRIAGYAGLLVCLDELVNLYKLQHAQARQANYEQILRILNDTLQGGAQGIGFILAGTPEFLLDPRRGLYSYSALQSRLTENPYIREGLVDFSHPVLRLAQLSEEEFLVLLKRVRDAFYNQDETRGYLPDDALLAFMGHHRARLGAAYFKTPRLTLTTFLDLLFTLEQNPGATWESLLGQVTPKTDQPVEAVEAAPAPADDDDLTQFTL